MGVLRSTQIPEAEELEFLRVKPPLSEEDGRTVGFGATRRFGRPHEGEGGGAAAGGDGVLLPVCVTSAASYIGRAVVRCLLNRGYTVRLALDSQEDLENLQGEMEVLQGTRGGKISTVMANLMDVDGLSAAFDGCAGVFHTSAFVDPAGIAGYSKPMALTEAAAAAKVVEACARTPSVRRCVFTSSLLACVWRRHHRGQQGDPEILDESCWSDETLCRDKKLWLALGKTMAERAAWTAAGSRDVRLVTVCPGLLTGAGFCSGNASRSVAYLKDGGEMYAAGLLATAEVGRVAEAHVRVYEAMGGGGGACGRYICFDRVVRRDEDAAELGRQLGLAKPLPDAATRGDAACLVLSNSKLRRLMSRRTCPDGVPTDLYQG